jgi:hypothetical protein
MQRRTPHRVRYTDLTLLAKSAFHFLIQTTMCDEMGLHDPLPYCWLRTGLRLAHVAERWANCRTEEHRTVNAHCADFAVTGCTGDEELHSTGIHHLIPRADNR